VTTGPLPFVPTEQHGRLVIIATLAYAGDVKAGERAVASFRALATPIADLVKPMPYPEIYPPEEEGYHPTAVSRTMFIDAIDRDGSESIVEHLQASTAPLSVAQLRVLGGAMARVPAEATAFAHRASRHMVSVAAVYQRPEDAEARIRQAYPGPTWDRLAAIKARHDPTNLFHLNQNIPPTAGDSDGEVSAPWNRDLRTG
jgi:Berberine and berberine like